MSGFWNEVDGGGVRGGKQTNHQTNKHAIFTDLVSGESVACLASHESAARTPSVSEAAANDRREELT